MNEHYNDEKHENKEYKGMSLEDLERNFKELAKEVKNGGASLGDLIKKSTVKKKVQKVPYFRNYDPQIFDFLARAITQKECEEIINYCLTRNEITEEEANMLRSRLEKGGPQSFGSRRPGYYESKL